VRVAKLPLRTQETVATRVGAWPEGILSLLGAAALGLAIGVAVRRRRVSAA
jgi:apolipoprotein N-acyltransferase